MKKLKIALFTSVLIAALATVLSAEERTAPCGMRYIFQPPGAVTKQRPLPILLCLHGLGDKPQNFLMFISGIGTNFIRVAPYPSQPGQWQPGDEDKLANLVEDLQKQYTITQVIVLGFSGGASLGVQFAMKYPHLVNGVISHSGGNPYGSQVAPTPDAYRMAVYLIHGTADTTVPISSSREAKKDFDAKGCKWTYLEEIPGWGHKINPGACKRGMQWIADAIKKGGGGGTTPWTKEEIDERVKKALELAKEKKYDDALKIFEEFSTKMRIMDSKAGKILVDALKPMTDSADKAELAFGLRAAGFAGEPAHAILKKYLSEKEGEDLYLAAIDALGRGGEKSLPLLHPILKSKDLGYKAAKAAVAACAAIKSPSSAKPLVELLEDVEKDSGEMAAALKEPVISALRSITGASLTTAADWKDLAKKKNYK
jgi:phospholipase/carboxylesterase